MLQDSLVFSKLRYCVFTTQCFVIRKIVRSKHGCRVKRSFLAFEAESSTFSPRFYIQLTVFFLFSRVWINWSSFSIFFYVCFSGDPLQDFTLMRFLDRFVFRNPKKDVKINSKVFNKRNAYRSQGVRALAPDSNEYLSKDIGQIPIDER